MPISEKQLAANRANALKSTGPRSDEGKARSSMNGFSSPWLAGLTAVMNDEDRLSQGCFIEEFMADLNPRGAVEIQLARTIALDNWRLNRIKSVEENIFAWGTLVSPGIKAESDIQEVENAMAHASSYLKHADKINQISLYEARLNRAIAGNLKLLEKRQADRLKRTPAPVHEPIEITRAAHANQSLTFTNGFAPQQNITPPTPSLVQPFSPPQAA
jgi:hypothetical protein